MTGGLEEVALYEHAHFLYQYRGAKSEKLGLNISYPFPFLPLPSLSSPFLALELDIRPP